MSLVLRIDFPMILINSIPCFVFYLTRPAKFKKFGLSNNVGKNLLPYEDSWSLFQLVYLRVSSFRVVLYLLTVYWEHLNKSSCLNFLVQCPATFDVWFKSNLKKQIDEFQLSGIFAVTILARVFTITKLVVMRKFWFLVVFFSRNLNWYVTDADQ